MPTESPVNIDAILINTTVVYIKWDPPPAGAVNGEITGYQVRVRAGAGDGNAEALWKYEISFSASVAADLCWISGKSISDNEGIR